jgi:hypothetical protein
VELSQSPCLSYLQSSMGWMVETRLLPGVVLAPLALSEEGYEAGPMTQAMRVRSTVSGVSIVKWCRVFDANSWDRVVETGRRFEVSAYSVTQATKILGLAPINIALTYISCSSCRRASSWRVPRG